MPSFASAIDARAVHGRARGLRLAETLPWTCIVLLPAFGCARGVQPERLDAGSQAISMIDGGPLVDGAAFDASALPMPSGPRDAAAMLPDRGVPAPDSPQEDAASDATSCAATQFCTSPSMGGAVSGDTGADTISLMGTTSAFVRITITEDDHTPLIPKRMRVAATLNSPGADFDLFLFSDGCAGMLDRSEAGFTESVDLTWDDAQGEESARALLFEVRHKAGVCDPSRPWMLTVRGN